MFTALCQKCWSPSSGLGPLRACRARASSGLLKRQAWSARAWSGFGPARALLAPLSARKTSPRPSEGRQKFPHIAASGAEVHWKTIATSSFWDMRLSIPCAPQMHVTRTASLLLSIFKTIPSCNDRLKIERVIIAFKLFHLCSKTQITVQSYITLLSALAALLGSDNHILRLKMESRRDNGSWSFDRTHKRSVTGWVNYPIKFNGTWLFWPIILPPCYYPPRV